MSLDLESAVIERNQIIGSFPAPINQTLLLSIDITDHRFWVQKVYKARIHENSTIDECCRRFERSF